MWTIFKLLNLVSVLISAYIWVTANIPVVWLTVIMDLAMIPCISNLPIHFRFDRQVGRIILALLLLVIWSIYNESLGSGVGLFFQYLPVLYLIALPREYQSDLLRFVTKWLAILLIPSLIIYWLCLFIKLPDFGTFVMEGYEPFDNYIFYLRSTFEMELIIERFNAFFPEPGHLSMVCVFLMMANRFDFKKNPWLWVILISVVFSFSLAGYILTLTSFLLLKINSVAKGLVFAMFFGIFIFSALYISKGDNPVNQLIFERLKYDKNKGIEGNNRFFNNTDFEFTKALKNGDYLTGVLKKKNMDLISGSGFKIYILQHGLIGMFLVFVFYLSVIPTRPDWHYTLAYLFIIILCFIQNAYPGWYAWLFSYVLGLYLNSKMNTTEEQQNYINSNALNN